MVLFGGCKRGTLVDVDTELLHYSQLTLKGIFHTTARHVEMAYEMIAAKSSHRRFLSQVAQP